MGIVHLTSRATWKLVLSITFILASGAITAAESGHPDFTGLWTAHREPGAPRFSGFGGPPKDLPLTAEGKRRMDEYSKLLGPERANPAAYCADYGVPTMMQMPGMYPLEFIQKSQQLTIIYEVENETRRIYIGDRQMPPELREASRDGYSEGHWDGNVLVVKTTNLMDAADQASHPFSDQATINERFSMSTDKDGTKIITYTAEINDPIYYTRPVTFTQKYEPLKDGFIIPYRCPAEFWYELLDMRRKQLHEGKPVTARMSDVYKAREEKE